MAFSSREGLCAVVEIRGTPSYPLPRHGGGDSSLFPTLTPSIPLSRIRERGGSMLQNEAASNRNISHCIPRSLKDLRGPLVLMT